MRSGDWVWGSEDDRNCKRFSLCLVADLCGGAHLMRETRCRCLCVWAPKHFGCRQDIRKMLTYNVMWPTIFSRISRTKRRTFKEEQEEEKMVGVEYGVMCRQWQCGIDFAGGQERIINVVVCRFLKRMQLYGLSEKESAHNYTALHGDFLVAYGFIRHKKKPAVKSSMYIWFVYVRKHCVATVAVRIGQIPSGQLD